MDGYERFFLDGTGAHAADLSTLIRRRLARPASLPEGVLRRVQVTTRDGHRYEGGLLYASETQWALWTAPDPYVWQRAPQEVVWIPSATIRDARVVSSSTGLRVGEPAANLGFQGAAALPGALGLNGSFQGPAISTAATAGAVAILLRPRPELFRSERTRGPVPPLLTATGRPAGRLRGA